MSEFENHLLQTLKTKNEFSYKFQLLNSEKKMAFKCSSPQERNYFIGDYETPSKFINFNSHISQRKSWDYLCLKKCEPPKEISKFQNCMSDYSIKIEEENMDNNISIINKINETTNFISLKSINKKTCNFIYCLKKYANIHLFLLIISFFQIIAQ